MLIGCPHRFSGRVHGEDRYADVYAAHREQSRSDAPERSTAPFIGVVDKFLIGYFFCIADLLYDRDRFTVRGIALAACLFDGKSFSHDIFIDRIVVALIAGMKCMRPVCGHHEGCSESIRICTVRPAQTAVYFL